MGVQPTLVTNGWLLPGKLDAMADTGITTRLHLHRQRGRRRAREEPRPQGRLRAHPRRQREAGRARHHAHRLRGDEPPRRRLPGARPLPAGAGLRRRHLLLSAQGAARLVLARLVGGQRPGGPLARPSCWPPSTQVDVVRDIIPVHNPRASIADMRRRLRGEAERFHCLAGYKYFYLDWNYDLWRCEDWKAPLCPVWEFEPGKTGARRLPGLHHRLLPRCERDAALRGGARRRLRPPVGGPPGRRRVSAGRSAATPLRWARSSPMAAASGGSRAWADRPRRAPRAASAPRPPPGGEQPRRGLKYCPPTR